MKNITRCIFAIMFSLPIICASCGSNSKPPRGYYEKAGSFSFDPPEGWQIVEFPGLKYRVCLGPRNNGFASNINVVDEPFDGTPATYVEKNQEAVKKTFPESKFFKQEDFQTEDGVSGIRIIGENKQQNRMLRQTVYCFGNSNRKYVVTCSTVADGGESLDMVFDKSMKTFRIH